MEKHTPQWFSFVEILRVTPQLQRGLKVQVSGFQIPEEAEQVRITKYKTAFYYARGKQFDIGKGVAMDNKKWFRIKANGRTGWVFGEFIQT